MQITRDTRLLDLINQYPWLKDELPKINEKFKMLNTPMGKIMMGKATIVEMSKNPAWMQIRLLGSYSS